MPMSNEMPTPRDARPSESTAAQSEQGIDVEAQSAEAPTAHSAVAPAADRPGAEPQQTSGAQSAGTATGAKPAAESVRAYPGGLHRFLADDLVLDGTASRLTQSVVGVAGVAALAPGLRDLVASATARVLHRAGGQSHGIDLSRSDGRVRVRIDAHVDSTRSVSAIVNEIHAVVTREIDEPVDVDLRVLSRSRSA